MRELTTEEKKVVEETFYNAIEKVLKREKNQIDTKADFRSQGITSIQIITIVFEIEDALGVTVVDADMDYFGNFDSGMEIVGKLYLEKLTKQEQGE